MSFASHPDHSLRPESEIRIRVPHISHWRCGRPCARTLTCLAPGRKRTVIPAKELSSRPKWRDLLFAATIHQGTTLAVQTALTRVIHQGTTLAVQTALTRVLYQGTALAVP